MSDEKNIRRRKIKINVGTPPPADDRINGHKDFGSLLGQYEDAAKNLHRRPLYKNPRIFLGLVLVIVVAILVWRAVEEEKVMDLSRQKAKQGAIIAPPLPGAEPARGLAARFSADNGDSIRLFDYNHDLSILIPPHAFGSRQGEVKFFYRVISNPVDLFASGIRMSMDTSGQSLLRPELVIDWRFEMDGEMVQAEKPVYWQMVRDIGSEDAPSSGRFYRLDTAARTWLALHEQPEIVPVYEKGIDSAGVNRNAPPRRQSLTYALPLGGIYGFGREIPREKETVHKLRFINDAGADLLLTGEIAVIDIDASYVAYQYLDDQSNYEVALSGKGRKILAGTTKDGHLAILGAPQTAALQQGDPETIQKVQLSLKEGINSYESLVNLLLQEFTRNE